MGSFLLPQLIQSTVRSFLKQGFAQDCCLCKRSAEREVCVDCWRQILTCQQFDPLPTTSPHQPIMVWGRYQGPLKRAIAQFKYQNQPALASLFGEELGLRWLQASPRTQHFQVMAIPLHRDRFVQRGYNQAALIAKRFAQVVNVPYVQQGLLRTRSTQAQHGLSPSQREANLRDALALSPQLKQRTRRQPVLLIDDIFTTGVTTAAAQKILEKAHFKVLGTAVVAQSSFGGIDA